MMKKWTAFPLLTSLLKRSQIKSNGPGELPGLFSLTLKTNKMIMLLIGLVLGAYLDNRFAPKIRIENGKFTMQWADKNKKS